MENNPTSIPEHTIQVALIGMFAVIVIGLILLTIMFVIVFRHKEGKDIVDILKVVLESNRALQLITVGAVILAVVFLALINQINNNGMIALLSGISGYVLGNLGGKGKLKEQKTPEED